MRGDEPWVGMYSLNAKKEFPACAGIDPTMVNVLVFQSRALCAGRPQITSMDASSIIQN